MEVAGIEEQEVKVADEEGRRLQEGPDEKDGAVTLLDVLGWKGIWEKRKDALDILFSFIEEIEKKSEELLDKQSKSDLILRGVETSIISISDTIAIVTPTAKVVDPKIVLKLHAAICDFIIPESIRRHIPMRGATAYGSFAIKDHIMIGSAIDEAASWHEAHDWIGVTMTPSAYLKTGRNAPEGWVSYTPPYKGRGFGETFCVKWDFNCSGSEGSQDGLIEKYFYEQGPHTPEIAAKYTNTLKFLDDMKQLPLS